MAKFYGIVGYSEMTETAPGVFMDVPIEHYYVGDVLKNGSRWEYSEGVNDDISLMNRISIVGDEYMYEHFSSIRYVVLNGVKWAVKNIEVQRPRLILVLGGVYNGAN